MRQTILTTLLLVGFSLHGWSQDTIRVMTINIDQGNETTLQFIGEKIKSYHPDLVAVQEVDIHPRRGYSKHQHGKNFIAELTYYSDMHGVFGKAWDHPGGWDYGDAVLCKQPFLKSESHILKHIEKTEPRQLILIHTTLNGRSICFGSTHLCHENATNRITQMKQIRDIMRKQKNDILFVCGDLNSHYTEDMVMKTMKKWKDALPQKEGTFTSDDSKWHKYFKYDYILYYNKKDILKPINYQIICDSTITDHCICIADFVIY